jgi:hypothetical protein
MPQYQVTSKGFFDGRLYDPNGKRTVLKVDKPFADKDIPSWVEPLQEEAPKAKSRARAKANVPTAPKDPDFTTSDPSSGVETL